MIRLQEHPFDIGSELAALVKGRTDIGAVVTFTGLVRDASYGQDVTRLHLEHYPGMTERELSRIEAHAHDRWQLNASLIVHRYGTLLPGEPIVLVITASPHRGDAFAAASFLMDWLKVKAPFWKREDSEHGSRWVEAKTDDAEAASRWDAEIHQSPTKNRS